MITLSAKITFEIPMARSLKDKRQVARRLIERSKRQFNAAIAEVATQDAHQVLTIGIAVVSGEAYHARVMLDAIIRNMDHDEEAILMSVEE